MEIEKLQTDNQDNFDNNSCKKRSFPKKFEKLFNSLKDKKLPSKLVFIIIGIVSTVWFLIRVIPKPQRAAYPWMKVVAPFMSGFVLWLLSISTAWFSYKHSGKFLKEKKYLFAGLLLLVALAAGFSTIYFQSSKSSATPNSKISFVANNPIGVAQGFKHRRVAWVWNPDATNENMTNKPFDYWYQNENTNQGAIDLMLNKGIQELAGVDNTFAAWDSLFTSFNIKHSREKQGYKTGESEGIYKYSLLEDGSIIKTGLAVATENPSFLTLSSDSRFLLAVNEKQAGTVESFSISEDISLTFINRSSTGGENPCYVSANDSGFVLVSNYGSGNVGLLKLNEAGEWSELLDSDQHSSDEYPNPHAHSAQFESEGNGIISADLGINELWFSELNTEEQKLDPAEQQSLLMPEGSGPRHFVIHSNGKWIYVVNEFGNTVTLVNKNSERKFSVASSVSTLPENYTGTSYCADIHISADNRFICASNRGHNSIAIFKLADDGSLSTVGFESTRGLFPRNFAISPDDNFLLVANQKSNNIVSFRRDTTTGLLEFNDETEAPVPICILFYKPVTTSINEYKL